MRLNRFLPILTTALLSSSLLNVQPANADAKTEAIIGKLGVVCKNKVLDQFDVPNSDINVRLGATLQQDIDSGEMTAKDLKEYGASFDWSVSGKEAKGYCNVNGKGKVTEFKEW